MDQLVAAVLSSAADALQQGGNQFWMANAHCDTWRIWSDEGLTDEERSARYSDPAGMLRGWTTLIHGVLTSYGYLHD